MRKSLLHSGLLGQKMTDKDKELVEKANAWFACEKGKESIEKAYEKAMENINRFKMCRYIDSETLRKPFTI